MPWRCVPSFSNKNKDDADVKRCVDGYRESLGVARSRRLELQAQRAKNVVPEPTSPKISRVNRVVSKRLLPKAKVETREGIWHLSKYHQLGMMSANGQKIY